ncbi:hypothetical protein J5I95_22915, partial [Candidatus Poribacteria bacterium]|nr:hypothetical protein [Candidatus Poribacteria bacterium]
MPDLRGGVQVILLFFTVRVYYFRDRERKVRLEKFLSESGIASRRDAKKYISDGRVAV